MIDLGTIWFLLVFVLLAGYAMLDGFDLGVGVLHLFTRTERERRIYINAIGPVWDGNEVWLLAGGGALFAAFPPVYATVFSGFYMALMLLLTVLILRAVSIEFRGKVESETWKRVWDWGFGIGSLLAALLLAVAFGNVLRGVPIDAKGNYVGTFLGLLNPYSLLVGVAGLVLLILHGATYLTLKTEGEESPRVRRVIPGMWAVFVVLFAAVTVASCYAAPHLFANLAKGPIGWLLAAFVLVGLVGTRLMHAAGKDLAMFTASSLTVIGVVGLGAVGLFPRLAPSSIDLAYSLTVQNASSTPLTLKTMLIIALIGVPIVLIYTSCIYWIFRGKVRLTEESY